METGKERGRKRSNISFKGSFPNGCEGLWESHALWGGFLEVAGEALLRCRAVFISDFDNDFLEFLVREAERGRQDDLIGGGFISIWAASPRAGSWDPAFWNARFCIIIGT